MLSTSRRTVPVTTVVRGAGSMWGSLPAGSAGGGGQPTGPEGRGPLLPASPSPTVIFPIEEGKHFSSSSSLHSALGGQRAEDRRVRMGNCAGQPSWTGKAQGPLSLGGAGHWTPGCRGRTCPIWAPCPHLQPHWFLSVFPRALDSSYHLDYDLFVFKSTRILKTST